MAVAVKTLNGTAWASVKTWRGTAVASMKTFNGTDVTAGGGGPTLIAQDNFDSFSNTDTLQTHSSDWVVVGGSDILVYKPASDGSAYSSGADAATRRLETFSANQRAEGTVDNVGGAFTLFGLLVRGQSGADTCYALIADGTGYFLFDRIAGTNNVLSGHSYASLALVAGDKIALEANGTGSATRLKIQKDVGGGWVDVATGVDPGSSHYIDGGTPGVYCGGSSTSGGRIDDFKGYNL